MAETTETPPKRRKAELVTPPNTLKEKVGSGGFDEKVLVQAQQQLDNNTVDFRPIAQDLLKLLSAAMAEIRSGALSGEEAINGMTYPAMQLRAQGTMFHYPLVTKISNSLVSFLETIVNTDADALDIVEAHKKSITIVLTGQLKGDSESKIGKTLCDELVAVCNRYYNTMKT